MTAPTEPASPPRTLGFPVHALLALVPVGVFGASLAFDLASHLPQDIGTSRPSLWLLCLGVPAGVVVGASGLARARTLPEGSRQRRTAIAHVALTDLALVAYAVSALARRHLEPLDPVGPLPLGLALVGFALLLVGAGAGARLTYRDGVGVAPEALADAADPAGQKSG